jgi:hypothetical protein
MCVRSAISVGRPSPSAASASAASMASTSLPSSTRSTRQPYASNRARTSSPNDRSVGPSRLMWLSSQIPMSRSRPRKPAMEAASCEMPSIRSPSEQMNHVRWSMIAWPSRLNSAASIASASANPTALPVPCPSGPVVISTPGVSPRSGCPGVCDPSCRKRMSCSIGRS